MRPWWRLEIAMYKKYTLAHTNLNGQAMCRYSYVASQSAFLNGKYDKPSATFLFRREWGMCNGVINFPPPFADRDSQTACIYTADTFCAESVCQFVKKHAILGNISFWNQCNNFYRF
jgi:hypothetical protein